MRKVVLSLAFLLLAHCLYAYTAVIVGTSAPAGLEQSFIASVTAQYQASVLTNPFFANTTQITLFGLNPNYSIPTSNADLLKALIYVDSSTYPYGWANGQQYERQSDLGFIQDFAIQCSSLAYFQNMYNGPSTDVVEIDSSTCNTVLDEIYQYIYQQNFSSPTVIPGGF